MEVSGQDRAQAALTPRKEPGVQRLWYGRWGGGGEGRSERFEKKNSPSPTEMGEK